MRQNNIFREHRRAGRCYRVILRIRDERIIPFWGLGKGRRELAAAGPTHFKQLRGCTLDCSQAGLQGPADIAEVDVLDQHTFGTVYHIRHRLGDLLRFQHFLA